MGEYHSGPALPPALAATDALTLLLAIARSPKDLAGVPKPDSGAYSGNHGAQLDQKAATVCNIPAGQAAVVGWATTG